MDSSNSFENLKKRVKRIAYRFGAITSTLGLLLIINQCGGGLT